MQGKARRIANVNDLSRIRWNLWYLYSLDRKSMIFRVLMAGDRRWDRWDRKSFDPNTVYLEGHFLFMGEDRRFRFIPWLSPLFTVFCS